MPKPPKRFYSETDTQRHIDEYNPYLSSLYIPVGGARGIIRALLEKISIPNLNRQAAEEHLMAWLLHDNGVLEEAKKLSEDYRNEDLSADQAAQAEAFLASELLTDRGRGRVEKVLQEYSSHSVDRMREESDEILKAIEASPFRKYRTMEKWANAKLPSLLQSLKEKQACFSGCKRNAEWPPHPEEAHNQITSPMGSSKGSFGPASVKDAILAYFHGLSVLRVRDYLGGRRPKTQSRSQQPR